MWGEFKKDRGGDKGWVLVVILRLVLVVGVIVFIIMIFEIRIS